MTTQTEIRIRLQPTGWTAEFSGGTMPQGIELPLPFTAQAAGNMVKANLQSLFPHAIIVGA